MHNSNNVKKLFKFISTDYAGDVSGATCVRIEVVTLYFILPRVQILDPHRITSLTSIG